MNELPQSFYFGRVTEALDSVAHYVKEAREIADEIKPIGITTLPVTPSTSPLRPRLKHLHPKDITGDDRSNDFSITVSGKNLSETKEFGLMCAQDLSKGFFATGSNVAIIDDDSITATLDIEHAPHGTYHALARDKDGREALLLNAFNIKPKEQGAAKASGKKQKN